MSVIVEPDKFAGLFSRVSAAVRAGNSYPMLKCVRVHSADGRLVMRGTDLNMQIEDSCAAEGELGPCHLDAAALNNTINALGSRSDISLDADGSDICVSAGAAELRIRHLDGEFPELTEGEALTRFSVPGDTLASAINEALPSCAAPNDPRMNLRGILLQPGNVSSETAPGHLLVFGGDGKTHTIRSMRIDSETDTWPDAVIFRDDARIISKLISGHDSIDVTLAEAKSPRLIFSFDGCRLLTTLMETGQKNVWRKALERFGKPKGGFVYKTGELLRAVKTASAVMPDKHGPIVITAAERTTIATESKNPTSGSDACDHAVAGEPEETSFSVPADHLINALSNWKAETVTISPRGNAPVILSCPDDGNRMCVLMPLYRAEQQAKAA